MDDMVENMWTFMNLDMLKEMFSKNNLKITKMKDIDAPDSDFTKKHERTICFKGKLDEGHYVYVNSNRESKGTYESDLLTRDDDDGICHGAAIAFYICHELNDKDFCIKENPKTTKDYKKNYKIILNAYLYLIYSGLWDKALKKYFPNEVTWVKDKENGIQSSKETQNAKKILEKYIQRFI